MKQSTTLSMGTTIAGNPYLIQAAEYITPGLPYFAAIGIDDEDRHIRERVQTACETTGYAWPEGRTTLALMPTNQPKRPGLCALATAVCIMATAGTIYPDEERNLEMERIETINLKTETDALEAGHGITYDELRGADMLANARKRLENEMRPRGIEPDGEQAVKDAETVRQAGLNAITPSFFELFEDYIAEEDSQLAADGVELEARTAWMHEMYRAMLNTLKE